jgi:hypothetical protein
MKEKKQHDDFKSLLQQALSEGNLRERVIKMLEESSKNDK